MILKNVCPSKNIKNKKVIDESYLLLSYKLIFKKIMEHLESIQSNSLMIMYDNGIVPSNFKEITNIVNPFLKFLWF